MLKIKFFLAAVDKRESRKEGMGWLPCGAGDEGDGVKPMETVVPHPLGEGSWGRGGSGGGGWQAGHI